MTQVTAEEHCKYNDICVFVRQDGEDCKRPVGKCEHDTRLTPDPLALLEKWICLQYELTRVIDVLEVRDFVTQLRENPTAVAEQGRQEGWYP